MPGPVLITDDDASVRRVLVGLAIGAGFGADEAADAAGALERVRAKDYVVILLDLTMPHVDGYAIASELRNRDHPGAVVIVTAISPNTIESQIDPSLVDAVIHKPFDVDMVSSIIVALAGAVEQKAAEDTRRTKSRKQEKAAAGLCPYCDFTFFAPPAGDNAYIRTSILLHLARCPLRPELKDDRDLQRLVDDISDSLTKHFDPDVN